MKICYVLFLLVVPLLFLHPVNAGDFFHHLNAGKYVIQHHALPYIDNLSFTAYGQPWVAYGWGSGVLFYVLYQLSGFGGISVLFAMLGTISGILVFFTLKRLKISTITASVVTFLATVLISFRWPSRPEVLGPFFIIALLYQLAGKKNLSWKLLLFFWAWSVFYGSSVFMGVLILGLYIVTQRLFSWKHLSIFLLSLVAGMLNGYGLNSFFYIFQIPGIAQHVGEWLPLQNALNPQLPEVVLYYQYPFLVYISFLLVFTSMLLKSCFGRWKDLIFHHTFFLCISLSIALPFFSSRFVNLAPLLAAPILAIMMDSFTPKIRHLFLGIMVIIGSGAIFLHFLNFPVGAGIDKQIFEPKIADFLKLHKIDGNIYSLQETAAWLSWQLPNSKVFVDTRDDLYVHTEVFNDLDLLDQGKLNLLELLKNYGATIVVGDLDSGQTYQPLFYSNDWSLVYVTSSNFIFVQQSMAKKYHLRAFTAIDLFRSPPAKPGQLLEAEKDYQYLVNKDTPNIEQTVRLIEIELALNRAQEAKRLAEKMHLKGPISSGHILYDLRNAQLLGRVYTATKDCEKAFFYLKMAERESYGKLILYPQFRLPISVDKYLGEYYTVCTKDKNSAIRYFNRYLQVNHNPIEQLLIERKLDILNSK